MRQAQWVFVVVGWLAFCSAATCWAQGWGGGMPWGGMGGFSGGFPGGYGGGFDPKDMLRRADLNRNGTIEPSEMNGPLAGMIGRLAERAGLKTGSSLPVDKLLAALDGSRSDRDRQSGSSTPSAVAPVPQTNVLGFEVPVAGDRVPGFDVPLGAELQVPLEKRFDQRVYERAKESMRDRDRNKSGTLDGEEWTRSGWDPPLAQSDLNQDGAISLEELCFRYQGKSQADNPSLWASGQMKVVPVRLPPPPLFPGLVSTPVPGFGAAPLGSSPPTSFVVNDRKSEKIEKAEMKSEIKADNQQRKYAEIMISRGDQNKNGKLDRDEWGRFGEAEKADTNRDGTVTIDEMTVHLQGWGGRGPGGEVDRGRDAFGRGERREFAWRGNGPAMPGTPPAGGPVLSYRALRPQERLPEGLPTWFFVQDADGDGQVSMAEFLAASESAEEAAEKFQTFDASGDGMVSAEECLESMGSEHDHQEPPAR